MFGSRTPGDEEIRSMISAGNQEALMILYRKHHNMLRRFVMNNQGSREDAEDLIQEVLVAAWQNAQKGDFVLSAGWGTYLMAIGRNLWLKQLRKQLRFSDKDPADTEKMSADDRPERMDLKQVVQMVEQLDANCRKLLTLFYFEALDMEQIALQMGYNNADTAKAKKYQCFKRLEKKVKAQFNKEDFLG
jgi:RNA polymerase sigma factor (sigma-70 family)